MEKKKEWFLVKECWMEDFKDLTDAEFGMLIRGLYSNSSTSKSLDMLRKAIQTEFNIVNAKAKESYETISSKAKDAANARWSKHKELEQERMHKHTQALNTMLKHAQVLDSNAQASLSNANIEEEEEEDKEIEIDIEVRIEDSSSSNFKEDIFLEDSLLDLKDKIDCLISSGSYTIGMKIPSSYKNTREYIEHQYDLNYKQ